MKKKISLLIRGEGGAISVMAVIMIFAFLGILAVVLDLGHLHTVQNELRNAADAAALAGARSLMPMTKPAGWPDDDPPWPLENPPPCGVAIQAAKDTAWANQTQGGAERKNIT
ncbi:MAG TPA: pilus assembly protein TadG-related protein, partial [Desulfobaccales bacterium]|nr:pilus assembly protein TadG-related protein [Desulfobaccales bacterium]